MRRRPAKDFDCQRFVLFKAHFEQVNILAIVDCLASPQLRPRPPKPPSEQWAERLADFAAWQKAHQRLPKMSGDLPEKSLAHWLAKNKRLYTSGRLSALAMQVGGGVAQLGPLSNSGIF